MKYAVEQRLRLIDFLLAQYGYVNRKAIMDYFGISKPQASTDIAAYLQLATGVTYSASCRAYVTDENFKPVYK